MAPFLLQTCLTLTSYLPPTCPILTSFLPHVCWYRFVQEWAA